MLFRVIRELTAAGVAIVYISHHLEEALEIADHVVVFRDGELVAEAEADEVDTDWVIERWSAATPRSSSRTSSRRSARSCCASSDLVVADPSNPDRLAVDDVSLSVRAGEIVGLYGLMGAGPHGAARDARRPAAPRGRTRRCSTAGRSSTRPIGERIARRARARARGPPARRPRPDHERRREPHAREPPALRHGRPRVGAARARGDRADRPDVTVKTSRAQRADRVAQRRQPAEGRARQGAADRAARPAARRADPRHRRRREGRDLRAHDRAGQARARQCCSRPPSWRRRCTSPTACSSCAKGRIVREIRRATATREEIMAASEGPVRGEASGGGAS